MGCSAVENEETPPFESVSRPVGCVRCILQSLSARLSVCDSSNFHVHACVCSGGRRADVSGGGKPEAPQFPHRVQLLSRLPQPVCRLRRSGVGQRQRVRVGHRGQQQRCWVVTIVIVVFVVGGGDGFADPRGGGDRVRLVPQYAQHSGVVRLEGGTKSLGIGMRIGRTDYDIRSILLSSRGCWLTVMVDMQKRWKVRLSCLFHDYSRWSWKRCNRYKHINAIAHDTD